MENQITPKVAQVWQYDYYNTDFVDDTTYHIFITKVIPPNLRRKYHTIAFQYMDTGESDEMSIDIFLKYCKLVSG